MSQELHRRSSRGLAVSLLAATLLVPAIACFVLDLLLFGMVVPFRNWFVPGLIISQILNGLAALVILARRRHFTPFLMWWLPVLTAATLVIYWNLIIVSMGF